MLYVVLICSEKPHHILRICQYYAKACIQTLCHRDKVLVSSLLYACICLWPVKKFYNCVKFLYRLSARVKLSSDGGKAPKAPAADGTCLASTFPVSFSYFPRVFSVSFGMFRVFQSLGHNFVMLKSLHLVSIIPIICLIRKNRFLTALFVDGGVGFANCFLYNDETS